MKQILVDIAIAFVCFGAGVGFSNMVKAAVRGLFSKVLSDAAAKADELSKKV